jgi:hypothetical protein
MDSAPRRRVTMAEAMPNVDRLLKG